MLLQMLLYAPPQTLPLLSKSEYRRQLYEADVSAEILDHIENRYDWKPSQFLPALYNGRALSSLVTDQYDGPTPGPEEIDIGRSLLLVFGEVALQRGLTLPNHLPEPIQAAREVVTSLKRDGFDYVQGKVVPVSLPDSAEAGPLVKAIKDEITIVTEAGEEAFKLRRDKYGF